MNYHFYVITEIDEVGVRHYLAYRHCDFNDEGIPHPLAITGYGDSPLDAILDLCAELQLVAVDWTGCDTD